MWNIFHYVVSMNMTQNIIDAIEEYCKQTGLSPTTVGAKVLGSSSLHARLKAGSSMRIDTYQKAVAWFNERGIDTTDGATIAHAIPQDNEKRSGDFA